MNLTVTRRKPITVSSGAMIRTRYLNPSQSLPLVIEPAVDQVDLFRWARESRDFVQAQLLQHGAILFRGFPVSTVEQFHLLVQCIATEPMEYKERSSPRSQVGDNIYTSTDYPANESIFPHNEHSYSQTFPLKLFFWCDVPAQLGGETPLGDTRRIYHRIPAEVRNKFEKHGWMFVRNFNNGFGLPWQKVFQTEDKSTVEAYCQKSDIEWEWREGGRLRTRQVRPAVFQHPHSHETVWFNHATFFHISTLKESMSSALRSDYRDDELPNNTFYGDGSPIPDEVMTTLRNAYLHEMTAFPWEAGDVILLDNMLTAHAREPFSGPRRILVAMAEPCQASSAMKASV